MQNIKEMNIEELDTLEKFIYEKAFLLQKHLTYKEYLKSNPLLKEKTQNILNKCGITKSIEEVSYVIENDSTILIFLPFDYALYRYAVCAIYTDEENRNQGSAKKLLSSLDFFGSLYFDTDTPELISLLKSIGASEENVINNKPSSQFILDINRTPSLILINKVIKRLNEED